MGGAILLTSRTLFPFLIEVACRLGGSSIKATIGLIGVTLLVID